LSLPVSWSGSQELRYVDALFTATSAVCVTGLITKNTVEFSMFGQSVILALIQLGGLGIIIFTTVFLALPRSKISFHSISLIKKYYIDTVEFKSHHIIRSVLIMTFLLETVGFIFIYTFFRNYGVESPGFAAVFHSVSAFCNAGFSTFPNSLENFKKTPEVLTAVAFLIFFGGIGFVVLDDIRKKLLFGKKLTLYSKIVIGTSIGLIVSGAVLYYLNESERTLQGLSPFQKVINAVFQSVTTRTAGFNSIEQKSMHFFSKVITIPLMVVGGSSGSIAGGIKVSTFFIIVAVIFLGIDYDGELKIGTRKIDRRTIAHAFLFFGKAVFLLFFSTLLLVITETSASKGFSFLELFFEVTSAFGTVGLSLGITEVLSSAGKGVVIFTMFAGRVGLITMAISFIEKKEAMIDVPTEEVLIG
ncbi:MAG: potassium transporter, partial [Spirochaetales bacterium]|nr:potassium transporter [Spirochaetales bacterium]